jgi:hypothetical protein
MVDKDASHEVGYGRPPKSGQFPQGKSGNPKGRPRGSKNFAAIVLRESRQVVLVKGPRGSRKVTKLEAAVMQLGNKSAQGDLRAQREFFGLIQRSEESANSNAVPLTFHEMDRQVMESIRQRMQSFDSNRTESTAEVPE